jgi:hypothetical protein
MVVAVAEEAGEDPPASDTTKGPSKAKPFDALPCAQESDDAATNDMQAADEDKTDLGQKFPEQPGCPSGFTECQSKCKANCGKCACSDAKKCKEQCTAVCQVSCRGFNPEALKEEAKHVKGFTKEFACEPLPMPPNTELDDDSADATGKIPEAVEAVAVAPETKAKEKPPPPLNLEDVVAFAKKINAFTQGIVSLEDVDIAQDRNTSSWIA